MNKTSETAPLEPGLYLNLPTGTISLTRKAIEDYATRFLADPMKVPPVVKKAVDFECCEICPKKDEADFCTALKPVLPILDSVDKWSSHDNVEVVFVDRDKTLHKRTTTMQQALQHVSTLSLIYYCETGSKYWPFFYGIMPLQKVKDVVAKVYLNIYWHHRADEAKIKETIAKMKEEITHTTQCQIKRLRLVCEKDAFLNAFAITQAIPEFLSAQAEKLLTQAIQNHIESDKRQDQKNA